MMAHPVILIASYVVLCTLMILLGAFQKRRMDRYSIVSTLCAGLAGLGSVFLYGRTEFFPAAALGLAGILLVHGAVVHFPLFENSDPLCTFPAFRCRFVCNHETWVLVMVASGAVSALNL
jgi:hypothetical protein